MLYHSSLHFHTRVLDLMRPQNLTFGGVHQTCYQLEARRFAATGRSNQRHRLSRFNGETDALELHARRVRVSEANVVEHDFAQLWFALRGGQSVVLDQSRRLDSLLAHLGSV